MPMVIPLVAVFASGAVGAVVAGTATFAAYASVAGAVLSTVGALSKNKDLSRIGMVLSLGGGIANLATAAPSGASAAASAADVEANLAIDAAANSAQVAEPAAAAAQAGAQAAAEAAPAAGGVADLSQSGTDLGLYNAAQQTPVGGSVAAATQPPMEGLGGAPDALVAPQPATPMPGEATAAAPSASKLDGLGKTMTWGDIQSYFSKAQQGIGAVGDWMQKNPALVKVGGEMVSSMYGPNAERMSMEKSLMERARANLNNPVKLSFNKVGG